MGAPAAAGLGLQRTCIGPAAFASLPASRHLASSSLGTKHHPAPGLLREPFIAVSPLVSCEPLIALLPKRRGAGLLPPGCSKPAQACLERRLRRAAWGAAVT